MATAGGFAFLTLRQEVTYVWLQKKSGVTVLFLVNRYLLLGIVLLLLLEMFSRFTVHVSISLALNIFSSHCFPDVRSVY